MVVLVVTTLIVLFSMSVFAAIFQCCCRRKRTGEDSDDGVKQTELSRARTPSPAPAPSPAPREHSEEETDDDDRQSECRKLLEDDLGDFSAVQRETEILKSFRKPPPPKNRGKITRAARHRQEFGIASDNLLPTTSEVDVDVNVSYKEPIHLQSTAQTKSASLSTEVLAAKQDNDQCDSPKAEETTQIPESSHSDLQITSPKESSSQPDNDHQVCDSVSEETANSKRLSVKSVTEEPVSNGGNIFLQIDPTVIRSKEKVKGSSKIPIRYSASSPSEGLDVRPKYSSQHVQSTGSLNLRPGTPRKFPVASVHGEQMEELLKSLKTSLQDRKIPDDESKPSQNVTQSEVTDDDVNPQSRDRSYSDPTKQKYQTTL